MTKYARKSGKKENEVTAEECECRYSLAKRRGPAPGSKNEKRKSEEADGVLQSKKKRRKEKRQQQMSTNGNGGMNPMDGLFGNFQANPMGSLGGNIPLPLDPDAAGESYWFMFRSMIVQLSLGRSQYHTSLSASFRSHAATDSIRPRGYR